MALLEREEPLALLDERLAGVRADGRGRLVLVSGEAGIGKTTLLAAFRARHPTVRAVAGACDALFTPRPLGPLLDIATELGGALAALAAGPAAPGTVADSLVREIRRPMLVMMEDLHWADEATLDVLRLLARRLHAVPALVVVTYRDELDRAHPLRLLLGELPNAGVDRVRLQPLSTTAVAELASPDVAAALHARTGGNPFYVSELLAAPGRDELPGTVLDAVHARAARLPDGARRVLEAAAVVPARVELWLLEALAGPDLAHLEACLAAGMLEAHGDTVRFRHEIARTAIERALPPDRRLALHRAALAALTGRADPARLAHHAEAALDGPAVLEHAAAAGERAARVGAHREAAEQYARALRHAAGLPARERAALLERRAYECYLTERIDEAIEAREAALAAYREIGDRRSAGDTQRWLSRLAWFTGDSARAEEAGLRAVALLEPLPPGPELAWAYSNLAQLRMLAFDTPGAADWGERAIALAEQLGEQEILVHALNNVGSAEWRSGLPAGREKLQRSLALALAHELEEHAARAYTNVASLAVGARDYAVADRHLDDGLRYCHELDLDSWTVYMRGWAARSALEQGRWDEAAGHAAAVLDRPVVSAVSRIGPLVVLGVLRVRRGDPGGQAALDEAFALAARTGELQRLAPVAAARAEARWLSGEPARVEEETAAALELALAQDEPWTPGELLVWRHRAGLTDEAPAGLPAPYRAELTGDHRRAAALWDALGCPYDAALSLAGAEEEDALRDAHARLQGLGARATAALVARRLRERGARGLRRGPRAPTRENPAGLTARQLEVLALLADGRRNAEIADALFLSSKTVDHHVSAILRKLGVRTRGEAGAAAMRLGLLER